MPLPMGMTATYLGALCSMAIGLILHIVGLATSNWSVSRSDTSYGLWEICGDSRCVKYGDHGIPYFDEIKASDAFAIIGMLIGAVALVVALMYVVLPTMGKSASGTFPMIAMGAAIFALVCVLICVIVWGAKFHEKVGEGAHLGYSFGLSIAGGVLVGIGGVLVQIGKGQPTA